MPVRSSPSHRGSLAKQVPGKASRSARRESLRVSFRGNHFSSFLPAATDIQRNRDQASRRLRTLFPGNRFPSILPAETVRYEARRLGPPHYFSTEPLFLIPFGLTDAVGRAQRLSPAVSSSSSQQGDNESLAVRKTDASALRLLPPTS